MQSKFKKREFMLLAASAVAFFIVPELAHAQFWPEQQYTYRQPAGYGLFMAILRVLLVVGLGGLGFAIGWFFSSKAATFRKLVLLALGVVAGLIVLFGSGAISWGLAWALGYIAFLAGLGYWARGVVKKLAETPTTFGSAKWADAAHLKANKVFDPKPEPVSDPKPRAPAGNAWMAAQSTMSGGILPKFPEFPATKASPFMDLIPTRAKPAVTLKPSKQGIRMGFAHDGMTEEPFYYREDGHLLTVAPSRAGKGTTAIIPGESHLNALDNSFGVAGL